MDEGDICSICLLDMNDAADIHKTQCNHFFHKNCINTWFTSKVTCPLCRYVCLNEITHYYNFPLKIARGKIVITPEPLQITISLNCYKFISLDMMSLKTMRVINTTLMFSYKDINTEKKVKLLTPHAAFIFKLIEKIILDNQQ
jgi:hypothetical protein